MSLVLKLRKLFIDTHTVLVPHNVVIQIAAITKLQYEIKLCLRVDHFVESNNVRMLNQFHATDLLKEM